MKFHKLKCIKTLNKEGVASCIAGEVYYGYPAISKHGRYWRIVVNETKFIYIGQKLLLTHFKK